MAPLSRTLRPTPVGWVYTLGIAALATYGFVTESTVVILLTVVVALPTGPAAMVAFYLVYGVRLARGSKRDHAGVS